MNLLILWEIYTRTKLIMFIVFIVLFTMHKTHSGPVIPTHFSCPRTGKSPDRFFHPLNLK